MGEGLDPCAAYAITGSGGKKGGWKDVIRNDCEGGEGRGGGGGRRGRTRKGMKRKEGKGKAGVGEGGTATV